MSEERLQDKIASAIAHRACCGSEHDPANGKLHGLCVVCGVEWPCETAKAFLSVGSAADTKRMNWLDKNRDKVKFSIYIKDWTNPANLREAIDAAMKEELR